MDAPQSAPRDDRAGDPDDLQTLFEAGWRELLSIERIAVTDNFLDLAGRPAADLAPVALAVRVIPGSKS